MGVACFILAIGACSSSSGSGTAYSLTNCPKPGIPNTASCTRCLQSLCAKDLAAGQSACSSSDIECACDPSAPQSCMVSAACDCGPVLAVIFCAVDPGGACTAACSGGG